MRTVLLVTAAIVLTAARPSADVRRWPGVVLGDATLSASLILGLEGASDWLKKPECRALFSEFGDRQGRPLKQALDALQMQEEEYLRHVRFRDGSSHPACERPATLMFTTPGSRVVFLCAEQFRRSTQNNEVFKRALVLHETLHTLGLGEKPPSSAYITHRVLARCAR
jgi:hypothetical protein